MRDWAGSEISPLPKVTGDPSTVGCFPHCPCTAEKATQAEVPEVQLKGFSLLAWR